MEAVFTGRCSVTATRWRCTHPGEGNYAIPFLVFVPASNGAHPACHLPAPGGQAADAPPGAAIEGLVKRGYLVLAPDSSDSARWPGSVPG